MCMGRPDRSRFCNTRSTCSGKKNAAGGLDDRHLNTNTYRELGGVRGALQKRADEIYTSFGDTADSNVARRKRLCGRFSCGLLTLRAMARTRQVRAPFADAPRSARLGRTGTGNSAEVD